MDDKESRENPSHINNKDTAVDGEVSKMPNHSVAPMHHDEKTTNGTRARFDTGVTGTTVSCHNINYVVNAKVEGKKGKKSVLTNISLVFGPGMNAILGPTGSGKTSLLDVLAARKEPTGLSGLVLIDGKPQPKDFKLVSGYVVQDDVVMGTLTVRENLAFSAALRLPADVSESERKTRVDDVIHELGLVHCADTKVGTEFIRGVSGGERKRTNIGMELIIKPSVLFLDEPTTGLDASTASAVMHLLAKYGYYIKLGDFKSCVQWQKGNDPVIDYWQLTISKLDNLKTIDHLSQVGITWRESDSSRATLYKDIQTTDDLAAFIHPPCDHSTCILRRHDLHPISACNLSKRGRTIIFSIHQPRYSIYRLFDKLHLLSLGNTVFHGHAQKTLEYFSEIGYECEEHNNPPDFFLDVINDTSTAVTAAKEREEGYDMHVGIMCKCQENLCRCEEKDFELGVIEKISKGVPLEDEFARSTYAVDLNASSQQILDSLPNKKEARLQEQLITYPSSALKQFGELAKRNVRNIIRNPFLTVVQTSTIVVFSLIVGGIYFQLDESLESGIQNRVGAFFFLIMQQVFGNMSAIELFIRERNIFVHESASGFYRVSAYFSAKTVCDLLPLRTVPSLIYCTITYWMIGLKTDASAFFIYVLTLLLTTYTATSIAFAISSSVAIQGVATLFIAMCYVVMMIFSGLLVNITSLPVWLQWLQYLSIFRYGQNALAINELKGMQFCGESVGIETCINGTTYLEQQGIDYSTWGLWQNEVALFCMTMGLLCIAYIQLRRMPKLK